MWRLGSINRNVYLYSTAQTRILDFFVHSDLDAKYKNGLFGMDVKLKNYPAKDEQGCFYWAYDGDLNGYNKMNDGNFVADGLISPDQNYLPHMYIVKKVYQNILFEAKGL